MVTTSNKLQEAIYLMLEALLAQMVVIDGHRHGSTNPIRERAELEFRKYLEMTKAEEEMARHLEEETQKVTPAQETKPSSPDTEQPGAERPGSGISSRTFFLAKEVQPGELQIMATVTVPGLSSMQTRGDVLRFLRAEAWTLETRETWEQRWQSGQRLSLIQEEPEAGPTAGTSATSPDYISWRQQEESPVSEGG